jgi:hypothetical protein
MDKINLWLYEPIVLLPLDPLSLSFYQPSQDKGLIENINILARLIIIFSIVGTFVMTDKNVLQEGGKYLAFLAVISLFIPDSPQQPQPTTESYFDTAAGNQPLYVNQPAQVQRNFNVKNNLARSGVYNANNLGNVSQVSL